MGRGIEGYGSYGMRGGRRGGGGKDGRIGRIRGRIELRVGRNEWAFSAFII